jgi:flagellar assembly protein FliH
MSYRARLLAERDARAAGAWYRATEDASDAAVAEPPATAKEEDAGAEQLRQALEGAGRLVRRLEAALVDVARFREELERRLRPQLIELSLAISRRVLHRMAERDPAVVADMAGAALDRLNNATDVRVRVNPRDFEALHTGAAPARAMVGWVADPRVEPGGCQVESSFGEIDAGIDAQLAEISRALLESDEIPQAVP